MELTHTEQQFEKRILKSEDTLRNLIQYQVEQHSHYTVPEVEEKRDIKLFEEIAAKDFLIWRRK